MKTVTKIILAAAFASSLGLSGLVLTVYAKQPQSQMAIMPQHHNNDAEEQQEVAKLQPLAKITAQQAQQAAETAVGGKASSVKLEDENGNLVYAVEIGKQEVKVDAGNGRVLYSENKHQED